MTNTELIRQEIERRIGAMYNFSSGYSALNTCRELLDFIDSLPKESEKGLKWRTDKPTADVIVAEIKDRGYKIMYASNADTDHYLDDNGEEFSYTEFVKWADLEEEEVVTDCHQLEEEIDRAIDDLEGVAEKDADGVLIAHLTLIEHLKDFARHFAKWGAEHLIGGNKVIGDHIADDSKKVGEDVEEAARNSWFNYEFDCGALYSKCYKDGFKAGANWQREQDHDACYQCEKAYDNVFFRGEQHAIKMLKEEAIGGTVCGRVIDHINIRFAEGVGKYLEPKDISHIPADKSKYKIGDKVKVIILKDE